MAIFELQNAEEAIGIHTFGGTPDVCIENHWLGTSLAEELLSECAEDGGGLFRPAGG